MNLSEACPHAWPTLPLVGIEFDEKAFRQKVEKVVQGLFERSAAETQRIFDGVFKTHAAFIDALGLGRPQYAGCRLAACWP
jgi:hypothetical protein